MNENKSNINFYPGHMAKAKRLILEKLPLIDIVINVIDARIPKSSYNTDLDVLTKDKNKILVFSKYDLCDKVETNKWINYYKSKGNVVITSSKNDTKIKSNIINAVDTLMQVENAKRKEKGLLPKRPRVMIIGVSNVGKSTLINKLVGKKSTEVGNKPGVTKNINVIKIDNKFDLIDTPGILWPKIEDKTVAFNLASMTIIKEEVIPLDEVAIYILDKLNTYYKDLLKKHFGIDDFNKDNIEEYYKKISLFKSVKLDHNIPNYDKINLIIINSIKNETIKEITFDRL